MYLNDSSSLNVNKSYVWDIQSFFFYYLKEYFMALVMEYYII